MNEYVTWLKNKFGYSEELSEFLSKLIPNLVKFYGEEYKDTILSALSNCEIHFQEKDEDPKAFLNSYFAINKKWEMPALAGAMYQNEIKVNDNKVIAKPIVYIKRVFFGMYKPFDFNDDKNVSTLIHEICHMIKGYGKLKVENGKIIDSTGLMKQTYSYSKEDGVVQDKEEIVGIEEALNEFETTQILEMMTERKQEACGYKAAVYSLNELLRHDDILKVMRISQFRGDDSWLQYLGKEQSKILIDNFDILVNGTYTNPNDLDTSEKLDAFINKMALAQDTIEDFANNYCSKEEVETFVQSLEAADKKTVEMIQTNQNVEKVSSFITR